MNTAHATAEAELRAQVDSWLHAVLAMDIEGIVSHYASDILAFDAVFQLQFQGVEASRTHWHACLAMCRPGTMIFELHDVHVTAGDGVAFATALTRCGGTGENGATKAGWLRMTAGYAKCMAGGWSCMSIARRLSIWRRSRCSTCSRSAMSHTGKSHMPSD
jgi:ketosteroid isomerase-like protein